MRVLPAHRYVLPDRVVILEVDEQQHRYASAALCEREREFQILDDLRAWDCYAVLVRFNPTQKNANPWSHLFSYSFLYRETFLRFLQLFAGCELLTRRCLGARACPRTGQEGV